MTASSTLCIQLGSATAADPNLYSQVLVAKNADELASSKNGIAPSSLDKLDVIVEGSELGIVYNPIELSQWVPFLSAGSVVTIQIRGINNGKIDLQPVNTSFLLAGLKCASERREADGSRILTATRKVVPIGAAPLRKKNVVTMNIDLGFEEDDDEVDLVDEDGLLEDGNNHLLAPPPDMGNLSTANSDDCAGRKPCDNCTCGRAEQWKNGEKEASELNGSQSKTAVPSSSCGKCNLGDAFRCASCPFLGKPAFKPGEEHVVLQLDDDL